MRIQAAILAVTFLAAPVVWAEPVTVVTHETEKYFYRNGRMEKYEGQYEYTYLLDASKNTLTRTRIYDFQTKRITPDETTYAIQSQLHSHPGQAARYSLPPVIRAFGQTDENTVELLEIEPDAVVTMRSSADNVVLSRARRLK